MSSSQDETSALLPSSSSSSTTNSPTNRGILVNRVILLLLLTALVLVSVYFEHSLTTLTDQLHDESLKVEELHKVLGVHETVIERFNASVTNSDVLDRLTTLESDLKDTRHKMESDLQKAQDEISSKLESTLDKLSQTVSEAEAEIEKEVDKVKADVEQYVVDTQAQFSMENSFMVYQLAGTFTVLSCLISMWHMTAHLRKMNQPDVQRKILAILWMCPIYAVTSWFSLVFHSAEGYLAIIKDSYEAYVIYQFLAFCIAVLGKGDRNKVVDLLARHADHLTPPFRILGIFELCGCCVPEPYENNRALAAAILLQCQAFALQFVFWRPVTTTAMVVMKQMKYYGAGDGPTDYRSPQFYLTIIQNVSIFVAFTGLLKFYHAVQEDLAWCRPFAKFLCIKLVVFATFWQSVLLNVLVETTDVGGEDAEEWAQSAQNFLICLEMLLFSIAHFYCFPTDEWEDGYRVKHSQGAFGDSIALGDFFQDIKLILKSNSNGKKKKKKQPTISEGLEDETVAISVTTSNDETDEERAVKLALEESLGILGDDPDIAEAKQRLLESKVLSPEFFDLGDKGPFTMESSDEETETRRRNRTQNGPTERSALLSADNGSTFAEALRPSIFTTVASIAEMEKRKAGKKK